MTALLPVVQFPAGHCKWYQPLRTNVRCLLKCSRMSKTSPLVAWCLGVIHPQGFFAKTVASWCRLILHHSYVKTQKFSFFCLCCNKHLVKSAFYKHKRHYFNISEQKWRVEKGVTTKPNNAKPSSFSCPDMMCCWCLWLWLLGTKHNYRSS